MKKVLTVNAWLALSTVTYLATLYLVRRNPEWSPALKVALTLTPVLPGLVFVSSGLRLVATLDELQRRIQFEAMLIAAIGTVVVGLVMNVLNAHGIPLKNYPHGLELGGTYMTMFFLWCVGITVANFRYR